MHVGVKEIKIKKNEAGQASSDLRRGSCKNEAPPALTATGSFV
jgi:hypothetical protein